MHSPNAALTYDIISYCTGEGALVYVTASKNRERRAAPGTNFAPCIQYVQQELEIHILFTSPGSRTTNILNLEE